MAVFEIGARLGIACFLLWCLARAQRRRGESFREGAMLSLVACGFGILCDLKGVDVGGVAFGILLCGAVLGTAALAGRRALAPVPSGSMWPLAGASVAFFAGQGTVLVAVATTLLVLAVAALGKGAEGAARATGGPHTLRLKAQSIRGVVGRVEAVLERLGVATVSLAVDHTSKDKELMLTAEVALPPSFEVRHLVAALEEIEGVIQFALD